MRYCGGGFHLERNHKHTTWRARRGAITAPSVHLFLASGHGAQALRVACEKSKIISWPEALAAKKNMKLLKTILLIAVHGAQASHKVTTNAVEAETTQRLAVEAATAGVPLPALRIARHHRLLQMQEYMEQL